MKSLIIKSIYLILGIVIWIVFFPGVMSLDSYWMYFEALTRSFSDNHSLLLSRVLLLFFMIKLDLPVIVFLQIVLGIFGLRNLLIALLKTVGVKLNTWTELGVGALIFCFFSPLTPYSIYFATLWSETWLLLCLIWLSFFLIELHLSECLDRTKLLIILILETLSLVARINSIILFPSITLVLLIVLSGKVKYLQSLVLIVCTPLVMTFLFIVHQYGYLNIGRSHAYRASYALDLASMIIYDEKLCTDLYFQSCILVNRSFSKEFIVGRNAIDFSFNQGAYDVYEPFLDLFQYPRLEQEYWEAVREYPLLLFQVKLLNYLHYISPDSDRYFFQDRYPLNAKETDLDYFNSQSKYAKVWFDWTYAVINHSTLKWISFVHSPWVFVNIFLIIFFSYKLFSDRDALFLLGVCLIPASYYLSYFFVLTGSEFRFVYPATFMVQIILLSLVFAYASQWLADAHTRRAGRLLHSRRVKRSADRSEDFLN